MALNAKRDKLTSSSNSPDLSTSSSINNQSSSSETSSVDSTSSNSTIGESSNSQVIDKSQKPAEVPVDGSKVSTKKPEGQIVTELTDKREQYSRHFLMNDGSFEAVSYSVPVSFLKDGK